MPLNQANRALKVSTALGPDKFLLLAFYGTEAISHMFSYDLDLISEDAAIDFRSIVGSRISFSIKLANGERHFSGFVSRFSQLPSEGRLARYRAEVVPWLWFLTRTTDCRMYQNKNAVDIIKETFERFGFRDFSVQLQGSYPTREYCVQYRETAFNFVSRLMEEEGIFYFFEHSATAHRMIIGDSPANHDPCPTQASVRYAPSTGTGFSPEEDLVEQWQRAQEYRSGKWAMRDFNFELAPNPLTVNTPSAVQVGGNSAYELYDYPGIFTQRPPGERVVRIRMQQEEALHMIIHGAGTARAFASGFRFDLSDHPRADQNGSYLLTSVHHEASESGPYTEIEGGFSYRNQFTCIPYAVPFRAQSATPRPVVRGCQTAVVVGDEIQVDRYARVKVKFHWERVSSDSCWIRVSQPWAGSSYGHIWIPRGGQEVIVDFLEGDPDRPIIVGRVYNSDQMPPYGLPSNQTQSGFKTRSSRGGGGHNELRIEDKKGSEEIYLQAEKDWNTLVKNHRTSDIGANETKTIGGNHSVTVRRNQELTVLQKRSMTIMQDLDETIGQNMTTTVGIKKDLVVGSQMEAKIGARYAIMVGANYQLMAGANISLIAAGGVTITSAGPIQLVTPLVQVAGVLQASALIAPVISPAVGNVL